MKQIKLQKVILLLVVGFVISIVLFNTTAYAENEYIITDIDVKGTSNIAEEKIIDRIELETGEVYGAEEIKAASQNILEMGFFESVSPSLQPYNGGSRVIFEVKELPVLEGIKIKGNETYSDEKLLDQIDIESGKILNFNKLKSARTALEKLYHDNNYILARIKINISEENILTFTVNEGYINKFNIEGNEKTKDYVILREIDIKQGEVFNKEKLNKSLQKIYSLGYFEGIESPKLKAVEGKENTYDIVIPVDENVKTGKFHPGFSWDSNEGFSGTLEISEKNLMGNGQKVDLYAEVGKVNRYSFSFEEPWLFNKPLSFNLNLYKTGFLGEDEEKGSYEEKNIGGSVSLGYPLADEWKGKARYKIEDSSTIWEDTDKVEKGNIHSLKLSAFRKELDDYFKPTSGYEDSFSIESAGGIFGGDHDYTKYNLDMRRYYPGFKDGHSWRLCLNTGLAVGDIPSSEEYDLGGPYGIRGYDRGYLNGQAKLLTTAEYHIPIIDEISGLVFVDIGDSWENSDKIDLSMKDLHYSAGPGVRLDTMFGIIRLDHGFNEKGGAKTQFSIGYSF